MLAHITDEEPTDMSKKRTRKPRATGTPIQLIYRPPHRFLYTLQPVELLKNRLAENAEVSLRTVIRAIPYLEQHEMIKHTRTVGNAEMYQTNNESPIIQHLSKTAMAIANIDVDHELKQQRQGHTKDEQQTK